MSARPFLSPSPSHSLALSRPLRAALVGVAASALLGGAVVAPSVAAAPPPEVVRAAEYELPDTLFPDQGNPGIDVRHYDVRLRYQPTSNRIEAVTTLRIKPTAYLDRFRLDFLGLKVGSVRVDGEPAAWRRVGHKLVVTPRKAPRRAFDVRVTYAGVPQEYTDADGSTEGWVRTSDGAVALGEPVGAMTWVPSNNTPGDKATWTYRISVPRAVEASANGRLVRRVADGPRTTWVWDVSDPMATFLASVAIGQFDVDEDSTTSITGREIPIWSFVDPTGDPNTEARAALPDVIAFEEDLFGPYPFRSAGLVVDDADVGYALETQDRPFYPSSSRPLDVSTLVHESAHQWFGNSVTIRDWHDLWLAEGFATYAEWLYDAAQGGPSTAEVFDELYAKPRSDSLWTPAPTQFTDSADLFGEPVYTRGAMTLQALRERIGDPDFFRLLKAWPREQRHGNVRTSDLVALAERITDRPHLDRLFSDWVDEDGKPRGY